MSTVYLERILVKELLLPAKEVRQYWVLEEWGDVVRGVQTHYMESKGWNTVKDVVTRLGGAWISEKGSLAEFRIPKKNIPFPQPPVDKRELFEKSGEPESAVKIGIINGERSDVGRKRVAGNGREASLTSREPAQTVSETPPPQPEPSSATPGSPIGVGGVETTPLDEQEIDKELVEQIKESISKLGHLLPVVLDKFGKPVEGFHRLEADPNWPTIKYEHIDTPEKKVLHAIAFNWFRKDKSAEWKTKMLNWFSEKGYTPNEIAKKTGLSERTVYLYLSKEFKEPEPPQLASARLALQKAREEPATQELEQLDLGHAVACSAPGCNWQGFKPFLYEDKYYCPRCIRDGVHLKKVREKVVASPPPEVKTYEKPKETAEFRAAKMHPPESKMDEEVALAFERLGVHVEQQKRFFTQETIVDEWFPQFDLPVYLDSPLHFNRQTRDSQIRERLCKLHHLKEALGVSYSGQYSEKERNRIILEIINQTPDMKQFLIDSFEVAEEELEEEIKRRLKNSGI